MSQVRQVPLLSHLRGRADGSHALNEPARFTSAAPGAWRLKVMRVFVAWVALLLALAIVLLLALYRLSDGYTPKN